MRRAWSGVLIALGIAVACASPEELDQKGRIGQPCYPSGACDPGLVCVATTCTLPDASSDVSAGATGGADASSGGTVASGGGAGGSTPSGGSGGVGGTVSTGGIGGTLASGGIGGTVSTGGVGATGGLGGATGGTGGTTTGGPPPPGSPAGCTTCECCDPWNITWTASAGATEYKVVWQCIFEHTISVGGALTADLCSAAIGMCDASECANGVGALSVQACNASGCSAKVPIPAAGVPIACGGGCCC